MAEARQTGPLPEASERFGEAFARTRGDMLVVGTGLVALSIVLPLIICTLPRPVEPPLPLPRLDRDEADRHLQSLAARIDNEEISELDTSVMDQWRRAVGWSRGQEAEPAEEPSRQLIEDVQRGCAEIVGRRGSAHLLHIGDVAALALTRATTALELGSGERRARFFQMAREVGLLDEGDRLRAHPLVVFALAKASWREKCGIELETGMTPIELDGLDVFLVRFGDRFGQRVRDRTAFQERRLQSLERFSKRHPGYPGIRARAALSASENDMGGAVIALREGLMERPRDRALRNYLLYISSVER